MPDAPRWLTFARLARLPNVFTAFADIALAGCATGLLTTRPGTLVLLLLASGCLYLAGMVWNDIFDRDDDRRTRPFRPIPSGAVSVRTAAGLASFLMLAGITFALLSDGPASVTLRVAIFLAALIVLYDAVLKHFWAGPVAMGGCRFLNVLMGGLAFVPPEMPEWLPWHLAAAVGVYIIGVTWFARTEEGRSKPAHLIAAACVMALGLLLGLMLPLHFKPGFAPWYFPYGLAVVGFFVVGPVLAAIRQPIPKLVQAGVKRSIFGLVLFDAVLATVFVGWPGLAIAWLLVPALWLGKKVYST